jgi:hypothetical protein
MSRDAIRRRPDRRQPREIFLLSVRYRQHARWPRRFLFHISRICAMMCIGSRKGREGGWKRGGHGLQDGPTRSGRLNRLRQQGRCGGSAARRRGVLKAELAPGDAPESERRSGPQVGFPRKPLNSLDSRKKEAWITLPLALIFLPNNLDFPSPCFGNPSMNSGKSCVSRETTIPLPSRPLPMTIGGGWHGICETALCLGTKRPMGRLHR